QQRRRPRSVSGLIRDHPQTSQHTYRQKTDIFAKRMKIKDSFKADRQGGQEEPPVCADWFCFGKHAIGTDKSFSQTGASNAPYSLKNWRARAHSR
ncbi:hypothetical protein, partial [Agrobacterium tumefaciens]|uniref:hypothetical protein n=1 Tax=Agrobacterium tumefaciens TaxID=358 RepID=UPI001BABD44C